MLLNKPYFWANILNKLVTNQSKCLPEISFFLTLHLYLFHMTFNYKSNEWRIMNARTEGP